MKKHYFCKIISIALILALGVLSLTSCSSSEKSSLLNKTTDEQAKLINYIIDNGTYSEEQNWYYISKAFSQDDGMYSTSIGYEVDTSTVTFIDICYDSNGGLTLTYLDYVAGKQEQDVLVDIKVGEESFSAKGTINPATYSRENIKIHSYTATDAHEDFKAISEYSLLALLNHAQLTLTNVGFSLELFGFKNLK